LMKISGMVKPPLADLSWRVGAGRATAGSPQGRVGRVQGGRQIG
jgi:hypothetical protein